MGVLNVTPDSFSDGGRFLETSSAVERGLRLVEEGADLLDVGGESTRPGAAPVTEAEEIGRVVPVVEALAARLEVPISVDTSKAAVARAALAAGAAVINDVTALGDPEMAATVVEAGAGIVLMHMRGTPRTMQHDPRYDDVAGDVAEFLADRVAVAGRAGIAPERIAIDPGIGFGKTLDHNLELLARIDVLAALGPPVLVGVSRKAFLGTLLDGAPATARVMGTAAACVMALSGGARIFRVHDVTPVREALTVAHAIRTRRP
jgi:dihydropteroate synthase